MNRPLVADDEVGPLLIIDKEVPCSRLTKAIYTAKESKDRGSPLAGVAMHGFVIDARVPVLKLGLLGGPLRWMETRVLKTDTRVSKRAF